MDFFLEARNVLTSIDIKYIISGSVHPIPLKKNALVFAYLVNSIINLKKKKKKKHKEELCPTKKQSKALVFILKNPHINATLSESKVISNLLFKKKSNLCIKKISLKDKKIK